MKEAETRDEWNSLKRDNDEIGRDTIRSGWSSWFEGLWNPRWSWVCHCEAKSWLWIECPRHPSRTRDCALEQTTERTEFIKGKWKERQWIGDEPKKSFYQGAKITRKRANEYSEYTFSGDLDTLPGVAIHVDEDTLNVLVTLHHVLRGKHRPRQQQIWTYFMGAR